MQQIPQATAEFYRQQQRIAEVTGREVARQWRQVGDDFDAGWEAVRASTVETVRSGMAASTRSAISYTPALLTEVSIAAPSVGAVNAAAFYQSAPDSTDLRSFFDAAPIRAKQAVAGGASSLRARSLAGAWLISKTLTALADTRRDVVSVDLAQRPSLTGYVRMLNGPSCKDCVILAGKWFRWNEGFERHPNCDCVHIPAKNQNWAQAEGFVSDPYEYFNSLSKAEQDRYFGKIGARTIRDGGDIYRVVNIQNRGLGVSRQAVRYGTPMKMRPQDIYDLGLSRNETIKVLQREGYITGPQVGGGNIVGRFREAYQNPISRPIVPGSKRDRVLRARETGVRDPLDRATMTAQERRLFDAVYQREYARKYGYLPRTIGQNSADLFSGKVGAKATADRLALLDAQISRQLSKIRPSQRSMLRLVDELGLNLDEFATGQAFRAVENRIGLAAIARTQTGSSGGGGKVPPRNPPASASEPFDKNYFPPNVPRNVRPFPDEPNWGKNPDAFEAYWRRRQDALGIGVVPESLKRQEIIFYERFIEAGHRPQLIPLGSGNPTNDFIWLDFVSGAREFEIKGVGSNRYSSISGRVSDAVKSAWKNHRVRKVDFIVDLGDLAADEQLLRRLATFNDFPRDEGRRIRSLWVFSQGRIHEVVLNTKM